MNPWRACCWVVLVDHCITRPAQEGRNWWFPFFRSRNRTNNSRSQIWGVDALQKLLLVRMPMGVEPSAVAPAPVPGCLWGLYCIVCYCAACGVIWGFLKYLIIGRLSIYFKFHYQMYQLIQFVVFGDAIKFGAYAMRTIIRFLEKCSWAYYRKENEMRWKPIQQSRNIISLGNIIAILNKELPLQGSKVMQHVLLADTTWFYCTSIRGTSTIDARELQLASAADSLQSEIRDRVQSVF